MGSRFSNPIEPVFPDTPVPVGGLSTDGEDPAGWANIAIAPICTVCHRPLTDPASIADGMGPVCAGKRPSAWLGKGGTKA